MPVHTLGYIPLSDLTIDVTIQGWTQTNPGWVINSATGAGYLDNGATSSFTFAPDAAFETLRVSDNDARFSDDDNGDYVFPMWGLDGEAQRNNQTAEILEAEYQLTLQDSAGNTYELLAVKADGTVIGFAFLADSGVPPFGESLTVLRNTDSYRDGDGTWVTVGTPYTNLVTCFTRGVKIATPKGEVAIEDLREGDLVLTRDHGPQPLRWLGSTRVSPADLQRNEKLRPIRIAAGALGSGVPASDLIVSPQHRVLVRSKIAGRMFDAPEVLVAARQLLQIDGVDIVTDLSGVEYFHMLFDRHEVVVSNGAETESLYTGPEALKAIPDAAREEILALFPELAGRDYAPTPARVLLSGRQARKMITRHIQHDKALLSA